MSPLTSNAKDTSGSLNPIPTFPTSYVINEISPLLPFVHWEFVVVPPPPPPPPPPPSIKLARPVTALCGILYKFAPLPEISPWICMSPLTSNTNDTSGLLSPIPT